MKTCSVVGIGVLSLGLCAAAAQADWFNFGAVADGTLVTYEQPVVITDTANPALTATVGPAVQGGLFTKQPPRPDFPQASAGYLQDLSFSAVGIRVQFNKTVFCVPGDIIGISPLPDWEYFGEWSTSRDAESVDSGTFPIDFATGGGLILGEFVMPDNLIDAVEIHAYGRPLAGGERVELAMNFGDFFAVALSCRTDMDASGTIDVFDLLAYLDEWFQGSDWADRNDDDVTDVFDLLVYLDHWFNGGGC